MCERLFLENLSMLQWMYGIAKYKLPFQSFDSVSKQIGFIIHLDTVMTCTIVPDSKAEQLCHLQMSW